MNSLTLLLLFVFAFVKCLSLNPDIEKLVQLAKDQYFLESGREAPPYENLTTPQIIEADGYVAETHHVVTKDGYILGVHRIPYGKTGPSNERRPIAFLQHGLLCSSSDWIMDRPGRALAYLLADDGYDVWMGNARGNTYSRNHTTYNPDVDKTEFWEFTWDQIAFYDVPDAIDYALNVTGNTQVYYVGYSMGTTVLFALMSERPQYAAKIKAAALLAPVAYVQNVKGPLKELGASFQSLDLILGLFGYYEFLPSDEAWKLLAKFCGSEDPTQPICYNALFLLLGGFDEEEFNKEYLPIILSHFPAGTSTHTFNHYGQLINKGVFQKYDWGTSGNLKHYGQILPPKYNLKANTPDIALYWGQNDWLANPEDVSRLHSELVNVKVYHRVEWDKWNHLDFIWGIHAKEYVYDLVIDFLAQY